MHKLKIAIFDKDNIYRERFLSYLVKYKSEEMELYSFSDVLQLKETLLQTTFDVIVTTNELSITNEFQKIKNKLDTQKMLILSEQFEEKVAEHSEWMKTKEKHIVYTLKFQSMEQILHDIYVMTGVQKEQMIQKTKLGSLEVIGICSSCKHEMQGLFSMLYAIDQKNERKIIYLNFLEFYGFKELYEQEGDYNLSDLILQIRDNNLQTERFWQCVYEMSGISYILPFDNPENIKEVTCGELETLLHFLDEKTDFEMVIIDFGVSMNQLSKSLGFCSEIINLTKEGYFYQCQEEQFADFIEKTGSSQILERIRTVSVPYSAKMVRAGGNILEQLQWSEFGDFVRRYLNQYGEYEMGGEK